ncbi:MAG TPA: hypothetical protein VKI20_02080 [Acidimicrobiales bacterium]|nr:hypothetical protein [Acidimicrobiales bacterium]
MRVARSDLRGPRRSNAPGLPGGWDDDFGPFFFKFGTYFPYGAKVCLNGHHFAQRQAAKAGVGFAALDNGFVSTEDPDALRLICRSLTPARIEAFVRKWLRILPHPYSPEDRAAGYHYDISILQAEFSLTQVLDRPLAGRVFFEEVIRENLDAGRPDHVSLTFGRRITKRTPGRFRTRVITEGVTPSLHVDYKAARSKIYFKEGQALRHETTVNNTRDFGIGRRLHNLPALRMVGFSANRRLLGVLRTSCDALAGADIYDRVCKPVVVDGQRSPGLRFDHPVTQALLSALVALRIFPPYGFSNKDLRELLAPLLGLPPSAMTQGKMSYHLRRLRLHGLIERIPGTHRYLVTDLGLRASLFLTRAHRRLLVGGMAEVAGPDLHVPSKLRSAFDRLEAEMDRLLHRSRLAA